MTPDNWYDRSGFVAVTLGAALAFLQPGSARAQEAPSGRADIIAGEARLEVVFDDGFFTEGAATAPDGSVYFSDITFTEVSDMQAGHIMRYDPKSGETLVYRSPSGMSNGLKFDAQGRLLACEGADHGGRRVTRTDLATGKAEILASHYDGRRLNSPNDLTVDEKGRIYFSDPRYVGHETVEQGLFTVYRIDPDGSIHCIIIDAGKPNGVAVSPDQKTLYVVSNDNGTAAMMRVPEDMSAHQGRMALLAYDLHADGSATFREMLVDYSPEGGPDGLVCDASGNLVVAVRAVDRPGIYVYSPAGEELARIPTPALPTNVAYGIGEESKTLYITYGGAFTEGPGTLARIEMKNEGYRLPTP